MYQIIFAPDVADDLENLSAFEKSEILDKIDGQLKQEPTRTTRKRKFIEGIKPPWSEKEGFWQLRVGECRVFYEVDTEALEVTSSKKKAAPQDN